MGGVYKKWGKKIQKKKKNVQGVGGAVVGRGIGGAPIKKWG